MRSFFFSHPPLFYFSMHVSYENTDSSHTHPHTHTNHRRRKFLCCMPSFLHLPSSLVLLLLLSLATSTITTTQAFFLLPPTPPPPQLSAAPAAPTPTKRQQHYIRKTHLLPKLSPAHTHRPSSYPSSSSLLPLPLLLHMSTSSSSQSPSSPSPTPPPSAPEAGKALDFLRVVGQLKIVKRTGWVNSGIHLPESVADHMYRMAMCSFLITDATLDRARLMKLAVVHDLAEALVGDIVPHDTRYTKEQKRALEEVRVLMWMCVCICECTHTHIKIIYIYTHRGLAAMTRLPN